MNLMPLSQKPDVVFRVDASIDIGTGHVMRCLTLAEMLSADGFSCRFICRAHKGNLTGLIRHKGFAVVELTLKEHGDNAGGLAHSHWLGVDLQTDALETMAAIGDTPSGWLIVDHYALDFRWERIVRPSCHHLMVIDDLADRKHDCDLLLDQSLGRTENDYRLLIPDKCQVFVGAEHALLRPQFSLKRTYSLARRRQAVPQKVLIALGGVDKDNVTERVLRALERSALPREAQITVVMGPHAPWVNAVCEQAARMPRKTLVVANVDDMANLMSDADLAIGAAGGTSWERCAVGVPTILMILAENQRDVASKLAAGGAARIVELRADFEVTLSDLVEDLLSDKAALDAMSERAAAICDGKGGLAVARQIAIRLHRQTQGIL
ncbi:UDP-2,4-diacetamido-2,4,6-trideoxy-beta-L-altropyranose hydrolase [Sinorhizobium meliloti]|uniref:UDP-2,4-diacetamido-2,4, 6-trideoxy-beta-L-altropyranose hydrolase n=1 Tax=Rhizobium meliloti TaxID=382 RepID=UPI001295D954|nr:UDP-2,4-diacetamido-2,4,6-trideoxy-beta-L-altropyranose hydrolase [Sinorhizobium meliloti]MQX22953.1 UDP-2,4-diacetamido-2,4,6-trideoxy-beta-L-altropyranose hydrolase [Sinorhizobium meliloti]